MRAVVCLVGLAAGLLASGPALAASVSIGTINAALGPDQTPMTLRGGALCIEQGPMTVSELGRAVDPDLFGEALKSTLVRENVSVDAMAATAVNATVTTINFNPCLPSFGLGGFDAAKGSTKLTVVWTLTDRASGQTLASLTTQEGAVRTSATPGGLYGLLTDGFVANARAMAASETFRSAATKPPLKTAVSNVAPAVAPDAMTVRPWRPIGLKSPRAVSLPVRIASDFDRLDETVESFAFHGRAGEVVTVDVAASEPTLLLEVLDARGKIRASTDPKISAKTLTFTVPADGEYRLLAVDFKRRFGAYHIAVASNLSPWPKPHEPPPAPPKPVQIAAAPSPAAPPAPPKPLTAPALPIIPGVHNLQAGKSLSRPAGKPGDGAEMFQFIGGTGSKAHISAVGEGPLVVTLYTPEGAVMLNGEGSDSASVDAFLPADSLYFVSVARSDVTKPYMLSLTAEEPDPFFAFFVRGMGYTSTDPDDGATRTSCWVVPGQTFRQVGSTPMQVTLERGGKRSFIAVVNGVKVEMTSVSRFEGDEILTTFQGPGGVKLNEARQSLIQSWKHGAYAGYLCR